MKQFPIVLLVVIVFSCSNTEHKDHKNSDTKPVDSPAYTKEDLGKIRWIEGKWKGLYNGQPFYEIYKMVNDSTLEVISYEWDGRDSSKTSRDYVYWKEGNYYLGDKMNYKVIAITDKEIKMKRNINASNDVLWKYNNDTSWIAELEHAKGVTRYDMIKFDPWKGK